MEALLQIYMLKLKLEAVQREYLHLMALKTEYLNLIKHSQVPKVSLSTIFFFLFIYLAILSFFFSVYNLMYMHGLTGTEGRED